MKVLKSFSRAPLLYPNYQIKGEFDTVYKSVLCLSESSMKEIEAIWTDVISD